jgi:hypothetical protein
MVGGTTMTAAGETQVGIGGEGPWTAGQAVRWARSLAAAVLLLAGLGWLLARLVWLYYFFGLFFFLIAGLLVGAVTFRVARACRPVPKPRLVRGVVMVAVCSTLVTVVWEYRHFSWTVGDNGRFPEVRNATVAAGRPAREVQARASAEFEQALALQHPPGGVSGYVRWAVTSGRMRLELDGRTETISLDAHAGLAWAIRTAAGLALLAAGLWFGLESLRFSEPVSNILRPGEEAEEEE